MKIYSLFTPIIFALIIVFFSACEDDNKTPEPEAIGSDQLEGATIYATIEGVNSKQWTYFSLANQEVVGTSELGDVVADESWRKRTDWDFALCGDAIRTNSGTSGVGGGGLQESTFSFENLKIAPLNGYEIDLADQTVVYQ